jgi:hypothetical protein
VIIVYSIIGFNILIIAWAIYRYSMKPEEKEAPPTGPECGLVLRTWVNEYDFIDRKCPPCHGNCNQGRDCPARV